MTLQYNKCYSINIIGAPGVGKSTISALLFANMKIRGYSVEYVQEYVKKLVWTGDFESINNQYYLSKKTFETLNQIVSSGSIEFCISDGPLLHGLVYNIQNTNNTSNIEKTEKFILDCISKFNNINIYLEAVPGREYETAGRIHTEEESKQVGNLLKDLLQKNKIDYVSFPADPIHVDKIINYIQKIKQQDN
jgi:adenylate kinase family enzyme